MWIGELLPERSDIIMTLFKNKGIRDTRKKKMRISLPKWLKVPERTSMPPKSDKLKQENKMVGQENKYFRLMLEEIDTLQDIDDRRFAYHLLSNLPDYFFSAPASSSGKYHPSNDLGNGGLVRHSISVVRMLEHLLEPDGYSDFTDEQKELLKIAALFHDCMKSGTQEEYEKDKRTKFLHPLYAANFIMTTAINNGYPYEKALFIYNAVISHMGQWNTKGDVILPTPKTPDQKILHLADYLASRRDINMVLGEEYFDDKVDDESTITTDEKEKESV